MLKETLRSLKPFFAVATALLLLASGLGAAAPVIVLDPGHGGRDGGAYWGGVAEKRLTLAISKRVEILLRARGFRTAMTRRTDRYVPLTSRAALANGYRKALFVSIHCNADPMRRARGIETFYAGPSGQRLARNIHGRLNNRTSTTNRGTKSRRFSVLCHTRCPAALVECGFLTSPSERRLLANPTYQQVLARAIADGISASVR